MFEAGKGSRTLVVNWQLADCLEIEVVESFKKPQFL